MRFSLSDTKDTKELHNWVIVLYIMWLAVLSLSLSRRILSHNTFYHSRLIDCLYFLFSKLISEHYLNCIPSSDQLGTGEMALVVEMFGWLILTLLLVKSIYNLCHFVYTTFLGQLLGHGMDLSKCGPWAGRLLFR